MVSVNELGLDEDIEDAILAKYGVVNDERKLAILRNMIGVTNLPIIKQLQKNLPAAERIVYVNLRKADIEHFRPRCNIIVQRNTF